MKATFLAFFAAALGYAAGGSYTLVGWNDLGMHCMDGDYSVYTILPPYNTIHAQLIDPNGKLVKSPSGITITYQSVTDPGGSVNTTSTGKTNFWQFAQALFGAALAPDLGLTGNRMPGPQNQPQPMKWEAAQNWFTADGIPLTAYDETRAKNYYPMMRLVASDASGKELAHTDIVLPISDEMDCSSCHASGTSAAARPAAGWVNDPLFQRDYKLNILRRHDDHQGGTPAYRNGLSANGYNSQGLYATVTADGKAILCAACHASNALSAAGQPGVPPLTTSVHAFHASQTDPVSGATLDSATNRGACYRCHPGAETRCLRGAMGNSVASDGTLAIQCQSCHGTMSAVGVPGRQGWLDEPACQNCHTGTAVLNAGQIRFGSALDAAGAPRAAADSTFATQSNVPASGFSLYRFSSGHGGLACEACHGSTHAEVPSSHVNDNVQNTALQGHAGTLAECGACHSAIPSTGTGPHGMHAVGSTWVSQHQSAARAGVAQCQACHGKDYRGTVLSRASSTRTLTAFGTLNVWRGFQIGCYTCHSGPGNDDRNRNGAPVVTGASVTTPTGTPVTTTIVAADPNNDALTLWVVTQPSNATVGLNGNLATINPLPGFEGADSFTVAAWDGQTSSNLATVQLQVNAAVRPQVSALVNSASFQPGPIAPGEIVTIMGTGLGPATPSGMLINSAGLVNRSLAGSQVFFDGAAAPLLYTSSSQINTIAPWSLAGKTSTSVRVSYGGILSSPITAAVAAASPAIFNGAVVNQDGSVNSAANPAPRGSYLIVYATGSGPMTAPAFDGAISAPPLANTAATPSARIGGVSAPVGYAGEAPYMVSGALQVNVQIPADAPTGSSVPLVLRIGGADAPPYNVAVK